MRVAYILSDMIWDPDQPAKIRVEIFNIEFFDYNHDPDYPMNTSTMSFIFFSFLFFMLNYILIMIWKHEIKQKKEPSALFTHNYQLMWLIHYGVFVLRISIISIAASVDSMWLPNKWTVLYSCRIVCLFSMVPMIWKNFFVREGEREKMAIKWSKTWRNYWLFLWKEWTNRMKITSIYWAHSMFAYGESRKEGECHWCWRIRNLWERGAQNNHLTTRWPCSNVIMLTI